MSKELIMVPSVTYANKGRNILSSFGILTYIERTPKNLKTGSCGYSLGLYTQSDINSAIEILIKNGIKVLGVTDRVVL